MINFEEFEEFHPKSLLTLSEANLRKTLTKLNLYNLSKAYLYYSKKTPTSSYEVNKTENTKLLKKYNKILKLIKEECERLKIAEKYSMFL